MKIEDLRRAIDETDAKIVKLIGERIRIALEIGQEKKGQGQQVEDRQRENRVLENVKSIALEENISQEDLEIIYRQIMTACKRIQGIEVAFQGEIGAYSEEAAFRFFSSSIQTRPCESLDDVFNVVQQGEVPFGIIPIDFQ